MNALNKMKKNETYYVVTSWGFNRELEIWEPRTVEKVLALTGGAVAPKVAAILSDGRVDKNHWTYFFDCTQGDRSVYATREEAENAKAR